MSPAQNGGLRSAMASVSPPQNPKTPAQRDDPQHAWYIALQRIRIPLQDTISNKLDDKDDKTAAILIAMHAAIEKLLAGIDPQMVAGFMAASAIKPFDPMTAATLENSADQVGRPPVVPGTPNITGMPGVQQPLAGMSPQVPMAPPTAASPAMGGSASPGVPGLAS